MTNNLSHNDFIIPHWNTVKVYLEERDFLSELVTELKFERAVVGDSYDVLTTLSVFCRSTDTKKEYRTIDVEPFKCILEHFFCSTEVQSLVSTLIYETSEFDYGTVRTRHSLTVNFYDFVSRH